MGNGRRLCAVYLVWLPALGLAVLGLAGCTPPPAKPAAAKLPANFPDEFPVYPKTKVLASEWSMNIDGRTIIKVKWQGPGRVGQALDFYQSEFPKKGWDYHLKTDLQSKVIQFWRQDKSSTAINHLAIAPVDESEVREGVVIDVEIVL